MVLGVTVHEGYSQRVPEGVRSSTIFRTHHQLSSKQQAPETHHACTAACLRADRPWPRATFRLPSDLSAPGNIYRAQLLVTPKADACEEFWAMNPSGAATNSSCGGLSTGEPYREVRGASLVACVRDQGPTWLAVSKLCLL